MPFCFRCGGNAGEPNHADHCDGQQGRVEAREEVPLLISGLTDATYATSTTAAISVLSSKDNQRAAVREAIRAAGPHGRTDDELQQLLALDGSSERPRRWELWKQHRIDILRDDTGTAVKRLTRTHRRAVVWVTKEA
jgi:hypothetical protein